MTPHNTWNRKALALLSVPALAVPSAIGVQQFLAPESGQIASWSAAAGFETLYIGVNILILRSPELRRYARNVCLAAVATAVLLNSLAHYQQKIPDAWNGAAFDPLAAALAIVASLPLAGLAYAVSVLLHRLSEDEADSESATAPNAPLVLARPAESLAQPLYPTPVEAQIDGAFLPTKNIRNALTYACPSCGARLTMGKYAAARRYGHCAACKEVAS